MTDSAELSMLRETMRGVLRRFPDAMGLGQGETMTPGIVREIMATAATQGWTAIMLPEERGGLGLGMTAAAILAEEIGRSLAPGPFLANVVIVPQLASMSDAPWAVTLARQLAVGEAFSATCFTDEGPGPCPRLLVEYAVDAQALIRLSACRSGGAAALMAWPVAAPIWNALQPFDPTCSIGELEGRHTNAPADAAALDGPAFDAVTGAAQIWLAAEMLGVAARAGEMSITYAGARQQFGSPIGGYQAIKHRIVDDYVLRQNATALVAEAASAWDAGRDDRIVLAHAARAAASHAALASTAHCIQVHGAFGFSAESQIHLAYKRARRLACSFGDELRSRATIATHLVGNLNEEQA